MKRRGQPAWTQGPVGLSMARERGDIGRRFQNRLMVTRNTIDRLGLEKELSGHSGCVNCLEWNRDGSVLASASDDLHVILWDPYRYKQLHNIATGHTGNIFSVKFIGQELLGTCAADGTVRVRDLYGSAPMLDCSCHCGRVKRLAVSPDKPHLLWSAAEDGLVLQHDLRTPHRCNSDNANVLVNLLNHMGRYAEAKCVAVNPRKPYQLAVGANDFYVRLYDTRMIRLSRLQDMPPVGPASGLTWERQNVRCSRAGFGDLDNNIPRAAVTYYAPGHLSIGPNEHTFPKKATTYLAFSGDGNELLVNLGSEQVYIFDLNSASRPTLIESFIIQRNHCPRENGTNYASPGPSAYSNQGASDDNMQGTSQTTSQGTSQSTSQGTSQNNSQDNGQGTSQGTSQGPSEGPSPVEPGPNGRVEHRPTLPDKVRCLKETANELMNKGNYPAAVELYNSAIATYPDCALLYSNRAAALMRRAWSGDTYGAIRDCYKAIKLDENHVKSHFRLAKGLMDMKKPREAHECLLYFKDRFQRHSTSHAVFLLQKDINVALENMETPPDADDFPVEDEGQTGSALERHMRAQALDYKSRFLGHCNTTTDIKEANFLGPDANFVAAGSDDGSIFIWCRKSGNIVRCLRGDESIVNCVQLHPSTFLLATSGIESVVRLWSPRPEGWREPRVVPEAGAAAASNQQRMRSDPFESMLLNISFAGGAERDMQSPACRAT